jgi:tryptophan 2,3-dioxygenase
MSASQTLPSALLAELEYLKTLPQDVEGPIADTYERLQGVNFLRAATPPDEMSDPLARVYLALMQCRELAMFNMASLFRDCSDCISAQKADRLDFVSHHLRWIYSIARLNYDFSASAAALSDAALEVAKGSGPSVAHCELNVALQAFSDASMAYLSEHENATSESIECMYLLDGPSVFVHTTKNIIQLLDASFSLPLNSVSDALLKSHILRAAVHSIDTKSPSYMMQFRLLHQIPEVLSFEAARLFKSAVECLREKRNEDAAADLRAANICLSHVVSSLHPLVELMYPSEYYKFRAHLGQTSGSHSNDLAKAVLRQAYHSLAETFVSLRLPPIAKRDIVERSLSDEVNQVHLHISKWRALHIMLPRNVLGAEATSLIGSRNAEQIVQDMATSFESRDALRRARSEPSSESSSKHQRTAEAPAIDHKLRVMTGAVTKRNFPEVEKREGTFSPKRQ